MRRPNRWRVMDGTAERPLDIRVTCRGRRLPWPGGDGWMNIADWGVLLDCPVPPNMEGAFGYTGDARWVGIFWRQGQDWPFLDDGLARTVGWTAAWIVFVRHGAVAPHLVHPDCAEMVRCGAREAEIGFDQMTAYRLGIRNFGSGDCEPAEWLVLDRETRRLWALPAGNAEAFVRKAFLESHGPVREGEPKLPESLATSVILAAMAEVYSGIEEIERMRAWLDVAGCERAAVGG